VLFQKIAFGIFPNGTFLKIFNSGFSRKAFLAKSTFRNFPERFFLKNFQIGIFPKSIFSKKQGSGFSR